MRVINGVAAVAMTALFVGLPTPSLTAQYAAGSPPPIKAADSAKVASRAVPLFASEAPLAVNIAVNLKRLRSDRDTASPYRSATMSYAGADGNPVAVPLKIKTHGIWRLKHCDLPPLRLNFSGKTTKRTLFEGLEKPKMVSVCRDADGAEQDVLKELQLYRIYQLLTPSSHRARALRVTWTDSATGKAKETRYGFVFEDPAEMAVRLGGKITKLKGAQADDLDADVAAVAYVFEYLIANTDFSFNGLHNTELVAKPDGSPVIPIAYDFDFSGAVNAPYATVDPSLPIRRVTDRLYRGYCAHAASLPAALALFRAKKDAIYALYADEIGKLLTPGNVKKSLAYFDEFYDAIKAPHDVDERLLRTCVGRR